MVKESVESLRQGLLVYARRAHACPMFPMRSLNQCLHASMLFTVRRKGQNRGVLDGVLTTLLLTLTTLLLTGRSAVSGGGGETSEAEAGQPRRRDIHVQRAAAAARTFTPVRLDPFSFPLRVDSHPPASPRPASPPPHLGTLASSPGPPLPPPTTHPTRLAPSPGSPRFFPQARLAPSAGPASLLPPCPSRSPWHV